MGTRKEEAQGLSAELACTTDYKVTSDSRFKATATQGISQETFLALIKLLDNFLRPLLVAFIHTTIFFLALWYFLT